MWKKKWREEDAKILFKITIKAIVKEKQHTLASSWSQTLTE